MHEEAHRIIKTLIYKLFVYFPVTIIIAYIFYRDFVKDLEFAGASVGVGLVFYYLFDWVWHNKELKPKTAISATIGWILLLAVAFAVAGYDSTHRQPPDDNKKTK